MLFIFEYKQSSGEISSFKQIIYDRNRKANIVYVLRVLHAADIDLF